VRADTESEEKSAEINGPNSAKWLDPYRASRDGRIAPPGKPGKPKSQAKPGKRNQAQTIRQAFTSVDAARKQTTRLIF
jgi:hypothetical protein